MNRIMNYFMFHDEIKTQAHIWSKVNHYCSHEQCLKGDKKAGDMFFFKLN